MASRRNDTWQLFAENGETLPRGADRSEVAADSALLFGASHVWVWRRAGNDSVEVLLQRRAATKLTWPNHYDISAAGHIDFGESPLTAAVREAQEEIDLTINPAQLRYVFSLRTPLDVQEIDFVYLYEVTDEFVPSFTDGEVSHCEWIPLGDLAMKMKEPEKYELVNQGEAYFSLVTASLFRML